MRPSITLLFISLHFLSSLDHISSSSDDKRWLESLVNLVEYDYVDHCEQRANATWHELIGNTMGLAAKLEKDKAFGMFVCQQTTDIRSALTAHALGPDDNVLRRKVKLLLQPGDTLLETEQWIKLVTFGDNALNKIRFATNYDCGTTNCTLRELHYNMARQQDEETLRRMKQSWERNLPVLHDYLEYILPILRNASKQNNYNTVEDYWDALGEYEGAILKAREIWENVKPLYMKLHKYIALRLKGTDAVGKPLPAHLFRSLTGDDWSNIIESLLPKHAGIYQKVYANLQLKELGGATAFKQAAKLISDLNLGEVSPHIWTDSQFNSTCPTTLVDWCKPNKMRAITCKDVSIVNYLEAHEAVMKVVYKQTINLHSNNTYILREASRYSALYEAIPGFVSLLSLNPHALNKAGLFSTEIFNYNPNHHRLVLQLIMALRDLPKLNFYLAADEWRIKVLMGAIPYNKIPTSWSDFRKNFSYIETSDIDFLGDPYMVFNKPFIGKFMGLILKYQIYQSYAEGLRSDEADLLEHTASNSDRLVDAMMQGYGTVWPEMVYDLLAKREDGLDYTALTDYYKLLDDYLEKQLELTADIEDDDYDEPVINEPPEENEIQTSPENQEAPKETKPDESAYDINDNVIDTGDEQLSKFVETSTVGVLEIKNPVAAGDQNTTENTKEASYNTYWWIGIAVAVVVVVVLIAIIARKRHNHRKQLEKQRRENSRA